MPHTNPYYAYPRPTALPAEVEAIQELYQRKYGVQVPFEDAKRLLEGVAQFIYLTQLDHLIPTNDALHPVREEVQRERGAASPEH